VTQMALNQLAYKSMRIANLNQPPRPVLSNRVPEAFRGGVGGQLSSRIRVIRNSD
jgi:hypothetical protein